MATADALGESPPSAAPTSILIISASMGAGHDGAARELARRLIERGHQAEVKDLLEAAPLHIGRSLREGYEFELKHVPAAYDFAYRIWYWVPFLCPAVAWLVCLLTRRKVLRWVKESSADVVVSTYPLATLCLGRLRRLGRLRVPAVNFITDFGVHPLWVHRGIDVNLAVHEGPARMASHRTARPSFASGPLVSEAFGPSGAGAPGAREAARDKHGLRRDDVAVLIVAGSWGVGGVDETFDAVLGAGAFVPVVVCGRDEELRDHLRRRAASAGTPAVVVGWTDAMHELMAACDCLVENAGGLTAMEALRAGVPVITFRPIAGHGKENAAAMSYAGVTTLARDPEALVAALHEVTQPGARRQAQIDAGHAMFVGDAAEAVLRASAGEDLILVRPRRRSVVYAARLALGSLFLSALAWTGMTFGVGVAAAAGIGVTHPRADAGQVLFLGVRLDEAELLDPTVVATLMQLDATAILDRQTALAAPAEVAALAAQGVDIENGGQGQWLDARGRPNAPSPWDRASSDVAAADTLEALVGKPVDIFAPGRSLNAFDLVDAAQVNDLVVVPNFTLFAAHPPKATVRLRLAPRQVDFVSGRYATPDQLEAQLQRLQTAIAADQLSVVPLSAIRSA